MITVYTVQVDSADSEDLQTVDSTSHQKAQVRQSSEQLKSIIITGVSPPQPLLPDRTKSKMYHLAPQKCRWSIWPDVGKDCPANKREVPPFDQPSHSSFCEQPTSLSSTDLRPCQVENQKDHQQHVFNIKHLNNVVGLVFVINLVCLLKNYRKVILTQKHICTYIYSRAWAK